VLEFIYIKLRTAEVFVLKSPFYSYYLLDVGFRYKFQVKLRDFRYNT
jgi:hypothetical protein